MLLVALAAGCAGRFSELPAKDRAVFSRCGARLAPSVCGGAVYDTTCQFAAMRQYGDVEGGHRDRMRWLLENGCPSSMVNPDAYMARDEDDDRPNPVRPTPQQDRPMPRRAQPAGEPEVAPEPTLQAKDAE